MPEYSVEVPLVAWVTVKVTAKDEDEAQQLVPDDPVFRTARGGLGVINGVTLGIGMDYLDWSKAVVEEVASE